jgi:hypothetical protein
MRWFDDVKNKFYGMIRMRLNQDKEGIVKMEAQEIDNKLNK